MSEQSLDSCAVCADVRKRLQGLPESKLDGYGGLAEAVMNSLTAREKEVSELESAFRALWKFCETEMDWEGFRAEFKIGQNPTQSEDNIAKLRAYLDTLQRVPVVAECIGAISD